MVIDKSNSRTSIREILINQDWESKKHLQLSEEDLAEIVGSFSGVPDELYRAAAQVDKVLYEAFIKKLRLCKSETERNFPYSYERVVLATAMALDDFKKKIISIVRYGARIKDRCGVTNQLSLYFFCYSRGFAKV